MGEENLNKSDVEPFLAESDYANKKKWLKWRAWLEKNIDGGKL